MRQKINRPIRSATSQVIMMCAALTLWGIGVFGSLPVIDELKTGQAYSLAVFVGNGTKVSVSDSPIAFWMNIGFQIVGLLIAYITPIFMFREVVVEHKRKVEALRSKKEAVTRESASQTGGSEQ